MGLTVWNNHELKLDKDGKKTNSYDSLISRRLGKRGDQIIEDFSFENGKVITAVEMDESGKARPTIVRKVEFPLLGVAGHGLGEHNCWGIPHGH